MANKSFVVQYLIKAREQYVTVANKVAKATDKMAKKANKARKAYKKLGEGIKKVGARMSLFATIPIALLANHLKNAARDAGETESKFATVFRSIGDKADKVAADLAKNYGLASDQSKQLLADTGDLLTGFGFSGESALDLSEQVNKLAVDLASFTNFSGGAEGASAALTKALLGERESLKSLGIAISEENVKAKITQLLAEGQTFASLRQAKARATLALAIEQSGNAIGDFARTSQDLANQERITAAKTRDMSVSFGKLLMPIALKITKAIRGVVEMLTALSPSTKKAILVVAGLVAVIGPLLLAFGTMVIIWPAIAAGFAMFTGAMVAAFFPIALLAGAAFLIINNWEKVSAFFRGFADGITQAMGPTLPNLIDKFKEAAAIIASLFASDSEAAKNLSDFANIGQLVGEIIGGALSVIVRTLSGIGAIIGQVIGAVTTMDFSAFDLGAIKAEFFGPETAPVVPATRVDVGVQVGLDQGLQQTSPAAVNSNNARRTDVGLATGG